MKIAGAILAILALFLAYRPLVKGIEMPRETRASWVEPMASFGTGLHSNPELPPLGQLTPGYREEYSSIVTKSNAQKLRVLQTYKSGKGKYGILQRYSTVEGAWIYTWLIAEDGQLKYIRDQTRDGGAPPWAIYSYPVKNFRTGFMKDSKFVEGTPREADSPIIVIELDTDRYGGPSRFY